LHSNQILTMLFFKQVFGQWWWCELQRYFFSNV
jgi:hypothetical protein